MGIPIIQTEQDFRSYVAGVHMRKDFLAPVAFGIGAVRFDNAGNLTEAHFPKINRGENFGSAAAFADVTHHRQGNAVRELDFWELKELEQLFLPFFGERDRHPNTSAFLEVYGLVTTKNMKAVVVFVGSISDDTCREDPVFAAFIKELQPEAVSVH